MDDLLSRLDFIGVAGAICLAIFTYFLGIRSRFVSEKRIRKETAIHDLLACIECELNALRFREREGNEDDLLQIRRLLEAYARVEPMLSNRQLSSVQVEWVSYTGQIETSLTSEHIDSMGYHNFIIANGHLKSLKAAFKKMI